MEENPMKQTRGLHHMPEFWRCEPLDGEAEGMYFFCGGIPAIFVRVIPAANPRIDAHQMDVLFHYGREDEYSSSSEVLIQLSYFLKLKGILPPDINELTNPK
ncbi:hypothetical protein EGT74_24635 [Chitinophaga lutea]|uniref:Uncharacterized protein n=1 Tax=Chitinophaga lutea TaxID=2488634 RepID=A0A3N4PAA0_9BACT|nr:hypothetical protein [Chitinophaga lutea]RPE05572.1 hypothetical protein EGT74_24635 [Chitinophaga lutea]